MSNDSIKKEDTKSNRAFYKLRPSGKTYSSLPATKIGRFGVATNYSRKGYGTTILGFLKAWFTNANKTGCRFLVVDSYKSSTAFYEKNGFKFLPTKESQNGDSETSIMYFDLITFVNRAKAGPNDPE